MSYLWEPSSCVIQAPRALSSQTRDLLKELKDSHPGVVYECQRHRRQYGEVEQLLELVTNLGLEPQLPTIVINGRSTEVAGPISTVQEWCAQCPFQRGCYSKITTAVRGYTGIAGGTILHQGKPYEPRRGRVKRSRREKGGSGGL
jgi:hypothetical protein